MIIYIFQHEICHREVLRQIMDHNKNINQQQFVTKSGRFKNCNSILFISPHFLGSKTVFKFSTQVITKPVFKASEHTLLKN